MYKFLLKTLFFFSFLMLLMNCKSDADKAEDRKTIINHTITDFQKKLFELQIDSVFAKTKFNGSISIEKENEILYEKENGFENFTSKTKLNRNTVFAIGSISKQFTAVMILLLEEQGKLKINDNVSKYLQEFQKNGMNKITILQLLNHTSGISDFGSGLLSEPGKSFNYSNKGYRLLGEIIEKTSGKSYDQNAKELFEKVGMKNSSTSNLFQGKDFAGAYTGTTSHFSEIENMPKRLSDKEISVAAGGILSNLPDLHQWNDALYNGKILKPESLLKYEQKSTERNHPILGKMGYGLGIMMNLGKPVSYFHTGYVKGSPSLNIYYPETKTSVIILSNIADESKGKNSFFMPHKEVKKVADIIEIAVSKMNKEMETKNVE